MTIQNKTIIGFAIPEEANDILEFEKNNIDFIRHDTSSYVYFVKEEFYTINPKEEEKKMTKSEALKIIKERLIVDYYALNEKEIQELDDALDMAIDSLERLDDDSITE
jgi:hypothetical protein